MVTVPLEIDARLFPAYTYREQHLPSGASYFLPGRIDWRDWI